MRCAARRAGSTTSPAASRRRSASSPSDQRADRQPDRRSRSRRRATGTTPASATGTPSKARASSASRPRCRCARASSGRSPGRARTSTGSTLHLRHADRGAGGRPGRGIRWRSAAVNRHGHRAADRVALPGSGASSGAHRDLLWVPRPPRRGGALQAVVARRSCGSCSRCCWRGCSQLFSAGWRTVDQRARACPTRCSRSRDGDVAVLRGRRSRTHRPAPWRARA